MSAKTSYDAVIIGAGHNGLVAAYYLALAGQRVLVLEKNAEVGGATFSKQLFPGVDARVSVYSYLVSLLPQKILTDLGIAFETKRRAVASYTPVVKNGGVTGLLISNVSEEVTRESFRSLTGSGRGSGRESWREYEDYRQLEEKLGLFARKVWPTLLSPLPSKTALRDQFRTAEEREIWDYLIEKPLCELIEDHLRDDTVRGAVFTDAKIGVSTSPEDPSLLQNRTFLYHIIGQGTGEWRVPVGGMGALVDALKGRALSLGAQIETGCEVFAVEHALPESAVRFRQDGAERTVQAKYVLFNTSSDIANRLLPGVYEEEQVPGSVFKINMVLKRLPALKDPRVTPEDAFRGTFHLHEGYQFMMDAQRSAEAGIELERIPGEMYCHSLTDPSILSPELQAQGYQTLTLFGLDTPYHWFAADNAARAAALRDKFLRGINDFLAEDIFDCLAIDANGNPCVDAKSPVDLEKALGLPKGNIFHGNLTFPFAENEADAGTWGVETNYANVLICGSSAKRGGAVSGIPGHNAARKILDRYRKSAP